MAKKMSMTQFKKECVKHGYNPATATALKRIANKGSMMSATEFTPLWTEFHNSHDGWDSIYQLAVEKEFSFLS